MNAARWQTLSTLLSLFTNSLGEYLKLWERNLWLYASLAVSFATVLVIYAVPSEFPFVALRWVLGSVFVLFIPGYVTVEALFTKAVS